MLDDNHDKSIEMRSLTGADSRAESLPTATDSRLSSLYPQQPDVRTLLKLLFLWIWTIVLTSLLVATVEIYKSKRIISSTQKDTFNGLTIALILLLGLSFFAALKELATGLQRHIIRSFDPPEDDRELIKDFDSLLKVFQLSYVARSWRLRLCCCAWLFINLAAQTSTAVIGLTYSVDDGNNYNSTYNRNGKVKTSNLTCYFHAGVCPSAVTHQALAHAYGEMTLALERGNYADIRAVVNSSHNYQYYIRQEVNREEFAYRFNEYNPNDTAKTFPHFSNRTFTVASGECLEYSEVGNPTPARFGDMSAFNYTYTDGSTDGSILIPTAYLGHEGTTYIYRGTGTPTDDQNVRCGSRCLWMWAYRNPGKRESPRFFQCPIEISPVSNVLKSAHDITDNIARVAAASIALQGRWQPGPRHKKIFTQYQFYANGHPWEVHNNISAAHVGANMAQSAIGSLATMVSRNPPIHINGTVPYLGSRVSVKGRFFATLLACIVAAHFAVFALNFLAVRRGGDGGWHGGFEVIPDRIS